MPKIKKIHSDVFWQNMKKCHFWPILTPPKPGVILGCITRAQNFFWTCGFHDVVALILAYLHAKNQKKLMTQFSAKFEKLSFSAHLGPFGPTKIFFQKSGSVTFLHLSWTNFVPKIRKNNDGKYENWRDYLTNNTGCNTQLPLRTDNVLVALAQRQ